MQRGLWFVHELDPGSPAYNLCSAFRVRGVLDVPRLQQAFERVVSRHRLLRSTFRADGDTARQVVHEQVSLSIERIEAEDNDGLAAAAREARRPFDLEHGPLVRVRLVEEASGHNRFLLLVLHHILADERSLGLLWKEVAQAYEGRLADTAPAVQYDDYVHWLEQAGPSRRDEDLAFWRRRLDPLPDELRLPFEQPAPAGSGHGRLIERTLRPSVQAGIRRLATAAGATPFMVFAFAFRLLLHRYTDGQRVAFATPVSTRSHPATAEMIGYFLNPLVIATSVDEQQRVGQGVEHFCAELKALLAHASLPFDVLAAAVVATPASGSAPGLPGDVRLPGGGPRTGARRGAARADHARPGRIEVRPDAVRDRRRRRAADSRWSSAQTASTMSGWAGCSITTRRCSSTCPRIASGACTRCRCSTPRKSSRVSAWERGPRLDGPEIDLLPPQVLDQARRQPQAPAVTCGGVRLSYGDLETAGRAIAAALLASGVTPGDRVGMFLDRSTQMIAGVVGSHLAGAAYVPMDPSYPDARNRDVLADADVAAVVTTSALRRRLPAGPWRSIAVDALEHDAARAAELPGLSLRVVGLHPLHVGLHRPPQGRRRHPREPEALDPGTHAVLRHSAGAVPAPAEPRVRQLGGRPLLDARHRGHARRADRRRGERRAAPGAPGGRAGRDQPAVRPVALRRTARARAAIGCTDSRR